MSLQVWLPLNGNLKNNGLNEITPIENELTSNNFGKIGQCYTFNGSSYVAIPSVVLPSKTPNWSFSCWFYLANNTATTYYTLFSERSNSSGATGYTIFLKPSNGEILVDDGVRWSITPMQFAAATWYHLTITRSPLGKKLYINGILHSSTNTIGNTTTVNTNGCLIGYAQTSAALTTGNQGFIGRLNDVRIYDNCLSDKEVEEISKALVIHYKLELEHENILKDMTELSSWSKEATVTCTWDETVGMFKVATASKTSGKWGIYKDVTLSANTTYTFSIYGQKVDQVCGCGFAAGTGWHTNMGNFTTEKTQLSTTVTVGNADTNYRIYLHIYPVSGGTNYGYFVLPRLEVLNETRASANVYDLSGYQNDGIINNLMITDNDSAKYSKAVKFNGTNSYVKCGTNTWMAQGAPAMTINMWVKNSTWASNSRFFSCTENGGMNTEAGASGYLSFTKRVYTNAAQSSSAYKNDTNGLLISAMPTNEWIMLTFVYTTTQSRTYINGVLHHSYNNTNYGIYFNTGARLFLGCEAATTNPTSPYYDGYMNDFRLYYSALTENQILDLYHTSGTIDNKGNVYTREYIETEKTSITKSGIGQFSHIYDSDDLSIASILKTEKQIQGNTIYEY